MIMKKFPVLHDYLLGENKILSVTFSVRKDSESTLFWQYLSQVETFSGYLSSLPPISPIANPQTHIQQLFCIVNISGYHLSSSSKSFSISFDVFSIDIFPMPLK